MAAANPNWKRWIKASVSKYLKQVATSKSVPSLVEGAEDRSDTFQKSPHRAEIRMNGPFMRDLGSEWHLRFGINVLVTGMMGEAKTNVYTFDTIQGFFYAALSDSIPIYMMGNEVGDNPETQIGCLRPIFKRKKENPRVYDFGQIDKVTRQKQGIVDADYEIVLP